MIIEWLGLEGFLKIILSKSNKDSFLRFYNKQVKPKVFTMATQTLLCSFMPCRKKISQVTLEKIATATGLSAKIPVNLEG